MATPSSEKLGFAAAMVSSGRETTPYGLGVGDSIKVCNLRLRKNLDKTLYNFTVTLGIIDSHAEIYRKYVFISLRVNVE